MKLKCLCALDYGTKYCGVAYTPNGENVFPLAVLNHDEIETYLIAAIAEKNIEGFVIGLPLSTNGQENQLCAKARQFARRIKRQFDLPIDFVDERFSSKSAVTAPTKSRIDDRAAAQILEYYLAQY